MELHCPDALGLPSTYGREAVQQFLARFELSVSVWTVGRYLKQWGLHQNHCVVPMSKMQSSAAMVANRVPANLSASSSPESTDSLGDEMGVRSDCQAGRSYGRAGRTPVVPGTGKRFRCNLISTITNRGKLYFKVFTQRFDAALMLVFCVA